MDLKAFSALIASDTQKQSENYCFKIAQGIFAAIDKFIQKENSSRKNNDLVNDREAIY